MGKRWFWQDDLQRIILKLDDLEMRVNTKKY